MPSTSPTPTRHDPDHADDKSISTRRSSDGTPQSGEQDIEKHAALNRESQTPTIQDNANLNHLHKDPETFEVKWAENDPENPLNWTTGKKSWITFVCAQLALATSVGSSIISPAQQRIAEYTGISHEVSVLTVSLYIIGFAVGPLIWAPISELYGRRVGMLPAMFGIAIFSIGVAVSTNAQSILILRFFSGVCGSAPIANVSAALGDIWAPRVRGVPVAIYAASVSGGPTLGPVIGAAVTYNKHLTWRWTGYILAIWCAVVLVLAYFQLPEIYGPVLLKRRAMKLRQETGDERWWHPHEHVKVDIRSMFTKHFSRPLLMLTTEPAVTALALYASFVYALLYMTLEIFPIVFQQNRGWSPIISTLPFISLFIGVVLALFVNIGNQPRVKRVIEANGGKPVPEVRCTPMAIGGVLYVIGLFWFGWTANPEILWVSPVIAAAFIGCGFVIIFQQCVNYLIDTYKVYAASAVAGNTFLRSVLAASMPVAVTPMFRALGVGGGMSLLGGLAALAVPIPFLLMRYGVKLRRMSKFAPTDD